MCPFCDLVEENAEHIIWDCRISRICWVLVTDFAGVDLNKVGTFMWESWLLSNWRSRIGNQGFKSLLATCVWDIWKAMCDLVIGKKKTNIQLIFQQALKNTFDQSNRRTRNSMREYLPNLFYCHLIIVMSDASWIDPLSFCRLGFIHVAEERRIILARAISLFTERRFHAEIIALKVALQHCPKKCLIPNQAFRDCPSMLYFLQGEDSCTAWRF